MSASSDRPTGRPMPRPQGQPAHYSGYDDVVTGPAVRHAGQFGTMPPPDPRAAFDDPETPPAQDQKRSHAPIVPPDSVAGSSLTLVISIMCFLACLTAGAWYMMNQSATAWMNDIASEVTIQIEPREGADPDKTAADVAAFLRREGGFASVNILSLEQSGALLEPWLGTSDAWKALPVPRLVAVELDRSAPPDLNSVRTRLASSFQGVSLDDHRQWQLQIRTVTRSFALGGLAILLLVGAATTAIIVSATKSSMASNREIVEVLHFVGATDKFIAREFEKHFLRLGIRAGLLGAVSAMLVFFAIPWVIGILGGGTVTMAEMHRLIGAGTLDAAGYVLLMIVVVIISALCMITSRLGVYRILNARD